LNVQYVIEGAVARSGNRVRVTAQLIEGAADRHVWAESYELDLGDVLSLEGEIAKAVAREVQVRLNPEVEKLFARQRKIVPQAYEAYLKGRYFENKLTEEALNRSI
jgi:adenylate cyclase